MVSCGKASWVIWSRQSTSPLRFHSVEKEISERDLMQMLEFLATFYYLPFCHNSGCCSKSFALHFTSFYLKIYLYTVGVGNTTTSHTLAAENNTPITVQNLWKTTELFCIAWVSSQTGGSTKKFMLWHSVISNPIWLMTQTVHVCTTWGVLPFWEFFT